MKRITIISAYSPVDDFIVHIFIERVIKTGGKNALVGFTKDS